MSKIAWVAGASGLVGQQLIAQLSEDADFSKVIALVRKPLDTPAFEHKKVEQFIVNFDKLVAPSSTVDSLFCALGSTTKKTPNYDDYYKIDVTYPYEFAKLGKTKGARFYGLVSAHGANQRSLSSYFKMKGLLEKDLSKLLYTNLVFARPSLLIGDRKEFRLLEKLSESFMSLIPGNYKAIHVKNVAASLITASKNSSEKKRVLTSKEMQKPEKISFSK
tara:strand:- start:17047 stop:17703 length:657 start_codon:yes stop_codon:yes gene_type:complete